MTMRTFMIMGTTEIVELGGTKDAGTKAEVFRPTKATGSATRKPARGPETPIIASSSAVAGIHFMFMTAPKVPKNPS